MAHSGQLLPSPGLRTTETVPRGMRPRDCRNQESDEVQLDNLIKNCGIALTDVDRMDGINNEVLAAATKDLINGYAFIKANAQYIDFKNEQDEERYTREGTVPEAQEMLSVDKVWKDCLTTDKYEGHGFLWWVFIALLVDLSAFIFFNLAFAKENDNAL